jgi:ATP-dependent Clp protease ATP-binding subunit ClpA
MAGAIEAARDMQSKTVCAEHLLLGLLQEDGSVAHTALTNLGITADGVRADVAKLTAGGAATA